MARSTTLVVFRVTRAERVWLQRMAREADQPLATLIREAVAAYVADYHEDRHPQEPGPTAPCNSPT